MSDVFTTLKVIDASQNHRDALLIKYQEYLKSLAELNDESPLPDPPKGVIVVDINNEAHALNDRIVKARDALERLQGITAAPSPLQDAIVVDVPVVTNNDAVNDRIITANAMIVKIEEAQAVQEALEEEQ